MSLESLANPLERLVSLPTAVNLRQTPVSGPLWSASIQYFLNDLVISPLTDGAYIWGGGSTTDRTTVKGGLDPSDPASQWIPLQPTGVAYYNTLNPVVSDGGLGVYTFTPNTLAVPANSEWLITVQVNVNTAGSMVASDAIRLVITGSTLVSSTILPNTNATGVEATMSGYVSVGGAGVLTISGNYYSVVPPAIGACTLLAVRLF